MLIFFLVILSLLSTNSPLYCSIFTVSLQLFASPKSDRRAIVPRHLIIYTRSHNYLNFHSTRLKTPKRPFVHIFLQ